MMKHTLEKILEFGRTMLDSPPTLIGSNNVSLDVDYKVILMSDYVSKRVFELSGRPLEISFIYGGSVHRESGQTKLKLDCFYVSPKQKLESSYFTGAPDSSFDANQYFSSLNKRIVAIGHSHADYDVFHSATDHDNYNNLVGSIGIKIDQPVENKIDVKKTYVSISRRLNKFFSVRKVNQVPASFSYILPSLVFNAKGEHVDSVIASKSYSCVDGKMQTQFDVKDCHLRVYNKQASLTDDERNHLDRSVRKVLHYNDIRNGPIFTNKSQIHF